jgi:hypothetical protein
MALKKKPLSMTSDEIEKYEIENNCKLSLISFASERQGKASFFIKKPSRQMLFTVADIGKEKGLEKANDVLVNACLVAGDVEELESDDEIFFGLIEEIGKLVEKKSKL